MSEKALSIQQPWAWVIMQGLKTVENRDWSTKYRGRLWIQAGLGMDHNDVGLQFLKEQGIESPPKFHRGVILGSVELVDVVDYEGRQPLLPGDDPYHLKKDPWAFGSKCWIFRDPQPLEFPINCRGKLGLFCIEGPQLTHYPPARRFDTSGPFRLRSPKNRRM